MFLFYMDKAYCDFSASESLVPFHGMLVLPSHPQRVNLEALAFHSCQQEGEHHKSSTGLCKVGGLSCTLENGFIKNHTK